MAYLQSLFTEVYFKDITERYDIALPDMLAELTDDLCSSIGSLTNASKIANTLGTVRNISVSGTTISNYLNYLMESFLFSNANSISEEEMQKKIALIGEPIIQRRLEQIAKRHGINSIAENIRRDERQSIIDFLKAQQAALQHQIQLLEAEQR